MHQQAEIVCEVVRTAMSHCHNIEALFTTTTTYIAESSLFLLGIGSPAETTSMASILYVLAVPMDSDGALSAFEDRVTEFPIVGKAGSAGCP